MCEHPGYLTYSDFPSTAFAISLSNWTRCIQEHPKCLISCSLYNHLSFLLFQPQYVLLAFVNPNLTYPMKKHLNLSADIKRTAYVYLKIIDSQVFLHSMRKAPNIIKCPNGRSMARDVSVYFRSVVIWERLCCVWLRFSNGRSKCHVSEIFPSEF